MSDTNTATTPQPAPAEDPKLPSKDALAQLDTLEEQIETEATERQKQQREAKRKLIEKHHVHPDAFAATRRLKAMEPAARNAWLKHFLHYVEAMGLDKQLDLFDVPVAEQIAAMSQAGAREGLGLSRG